MAYVSQSTNYLSFKDAIAHRRKKIEDSKYKKIQYIKSKSDQIIEVMKSQIACEAKLGIDFETLRYIGTEKLTCNKFLDYIRKTVNNDLIGTYMDHSTPGYYNNCILRFWIKKL